MSFDGSKIVVLGAGTMGAGIAQWFAQNGAKVQLTDIDHHFLDKSIEKIYQSWDKLQEKGKFKHEDVTQFKLNLTKAGKADLDKHANLVIEAIVENLEIKKTVFAEYDKFFNEMTIFASNTSSISIASLASDLSSKRKERFLGLHFFNPATIMKLVEIIKTPWLNENVCKNLEKYFQQKGKRTALCQDRPGFIVNRVARNFYGEALRIAKIDNEEKFKEIDTIMKNVGGFKMGPFELMDLIGIDVNFDVTQSVWNSYYQEARFQPHLLQKQMVDAKRFGRKTKQGFYRYE